jgi:hypothetical protein
MKLLHKIKRQFNNLTLKMLSLLARTPERMRLSVPYVSQFANPSWAEMVLKDNQPIDRDLMWEESGARSVKEYERWVLSICGMACTAMALQFYKKVSLKQFFWHVMLPRLASIKKTGMEFLVCNTYRTKNGYVNLTSRLPSIPESLLSRCATFFPDSD